jgi:hypothetical protein
MEEEGISQLTNEQLLEKLLDSPIAEFKQEVLRRMNSDLELVGVTEVGEILGWNRNKVSVYRGRGKMPVPVCKIGTRYFWNKKQIEEMKGQLGICTNRET